MENNARFFNAKKPKAEVDRSWGIAHKVPVCPNCEISIDAEWWNAEYKEGSNDL